MCFKMVLTCVTGVYMRSSGGVIVMLTVSRVCADAGDLSALLPASHSPPDFICDGYSLVMASPSCYVSEYRRDQPLGVVVQHMCCQCQLSCVSESPSSCSPGDSSVIHSLPLFIIHNLGNMVAGAVAQQVHACRCGSSTCHCRIVPMVWVCGLQRHTMRAVWSKAKGPQLNLISVDVNIVAESTIIC